MNEHNILRQLQYEWMNLTGPSCHCSQIIHPGLSCIQQVFLKFKTVSKMVSKFYLVFHLIPFLIKLQKVIRQKRFVSFTLKSILSFLGSLIFMIHLVCGFKATICALSNFNIKIEQPGLFFGGPLTGISIIWESKGRKQQIAYYAFVRSIRAVYIYLLRRKIIPFQIPKELFFITLFGFLSYMYNERSENLKYFNVFKGVWGQV